MKENNIYVRSLNEKDTLKVQMMDEASGNCLEQWLDSYAYAYGIFKDNELIGYCSIGYADDIRDLIDNYPGKTDDSLLLSDVFVDFDFRHQGYGTYMIKEAIKLRHKYDGYNELVFCEPMHPGLIDFYKNLGFIEIGKLCMVIPIKTK